MLLWPSVTPDVLKMFVDEVGWQVDTSRLPGYVNAENVATVSESQQANDYAELVHLADCEPTVTDFNIFHEIDEASRIGFQSGVLRADFTERPAASAFGGSLQQAIVGDGGGCDVPLPQSAALRPARRGRGRRGGAASGGRGVHLRDHVHERALDEDGRGRDPDADGDRDRPSGLHVRVRDCCAGRRDEPGPHLDGGRHASPLTRTRVRPTMANTCSESSSSSC